MNQRRRFTNQRITTKGNILYSGMYLKILILNGISLADAMLEMRISFSAGLCLFISIDIMPPNDEPDKSKGFAVINMARET